MEYATKQVTEALQELTERESRAQPAYGSRAGTPASVDLGKVQLSAEVNQFLTERAEHIEKSKQIFEGQY